AQEPAEIEAEAEPSESEPTEQEKQDGRLLPGKLRNLLKDLKGKDAKLAGEIRDAWFTAKNFQQVFPSPKEAVKARETLDQLGGDEGIQAIEQERAEWATLDKQFSEGDPSFVDNIAAT